MSSTDMNSEYLRSQINEKMEEMESITRDLTRFYRKKGNPGTSQPGYCEGGCINARPSGGRYYLGQTRWFQNVEKHSYGRTTYGWCNGIIALFKTKKERQVQLRKEIQELFEVLDMTIVRHLPARPFVVELDDNESQDDEKHPEFHDEAMEPVETSVETSEVAPVVSFSLQGQVPMGSTISFQVGTNGVGTSRMEIVRRARLARFDRIHTPALDRANENANRARNARNERIQRARQNTD